MVAVLTHVKTKGGAMAESRPESPGRPRLEDVAGAVGLSAASVSLVLRGAPGPSAATRERVLEAAPRLRSPPHRAARAPGGPPRGRLLGAAARLAYGPARAASLLASRRSRLLGVMMDVRNSY